jgi:serine/threonine-protein kinase
MQVMIGQLIDSKYRIVRMLGEGGMGAVYEGENVRIHHRVAIKVLHGEIATRKDVLERFEREAQAAGKIGSEHIVEVFDLGELPDGSRYMVMEYLDGENLSARVAQRGRMAASEIAPILLQLLEGLGAAHASGIVHRDLKPDNIFLVRDKKRGNDFVKIVDFGVSKFSSSSPDAAMSMTRTGTVIGTPYYMSPEQAKGAKNTDHRSDLYAVGVVLFECATGRVPYQADTFNELMFKIVLEPPPDPESLVQGLDPRFAAIIRKAMAREPEARYQNAGEFQDALSSWMKVAGVGSGVYEHAPPPRAPLVSGADLQATGGISGGAPQIALSKTAGSLPGSVATQPIPSGKKSPVPLVMGILGGLALVAGGVFFAAKGQHGKTDAATSDHAAAAIVAAPEPAAPSAAPIPSAPAAATPATSVAAGTTPPTPTPSPAAAGTDASSAAAVAEPVPAGAHHHHGSPSPAAAQPSAAAAATSQVKGRTIRTDL